MKALRFFSNILIFLFIGEIVSQRMGYIDYYPSDGIFQSLYKGQYISLPDQSFAEEKINFNKSQVNFHGVNKSGDEQIYPGEKGFSYFNYLAELSYSLEFTNLTTSEKGWVNGKIAYTVLNLTETWWILNGFLNKKISFFDHTSNFNITEFYPPSANSTLLEILIKKNLSAVFMPSIKDHVCGYYTKSYERDLRKQQLNKEISLYHGSKVIYFNNTYVNYSIFKDLSTYGVYIYKNLTILGSRYSHSSVVTYPLPYDELRSKRVIISKGLIEETLVYLSDKNFFGTILDQNS